MNDLLDNGGVRFTDGGITYYLPITHHLTFLPDPVADAIEAASSFLRYFYYAGLRLIHADAADKTHDFLHWAEQQGYISVVTGICITYLAFSFLTWLVNRFSDGIWPSERALTRETRRRAEEYLSRKRD